MYDRQLLQPGPSGDRPLHKVCRGRALHNCLSQRDMRSSGQYMDSKTWMPDDIPIENGTAFAGELSKELMRHSQVAQAHSTT